MNNSTKREADLLLSSLLFHHYQTKPDGHVIYCARIFDLTQSRETRCFFLIFSTKTVELPKMARSSQLPWTCLQARSLVFNDGHKTQQWFSPQPGSFVYIKQEDKYVARSLDSTMKFIDKKYPASITLAQALDTFDCNIELLTPEIETIY